MYVFDMLLLMLMHIFICYIILLYLVEMTFCITVYCFILCFAIHFQGCKIMYWGARLSDRSHVRIGGSVSHSGLLSNDID